jgi:hypothetical protein
MVVHKDVPVSSALNSTTCSDLAMRASRYLHRLDEKNEGSHDVVPQSFVLVAR